MDAAGQAIDLIRGHAQGLAHVPHRAARAIADDGRRQGRPVPAVFPVDILDHLLPALVLEVHIDVRRLAALPGNEALEQHLHARRVHLGDPQAKAHRRVGGGAAPLTEDAAPAGEGDDVVDGQKIGLVAQLGDQGQLVLDQIQDPLRGAAWPTAGGTLQGQATQIGRGGLSGRDQLVRVLVAQLVQGEGAGGRHPRGLREQVRRVEAGQLGGAVQVGLAVLVQGFAGGLDGGPQADAGQGIE